MEHRAKVIRIITVSAVVLIFLLVVSLVINLIKLADASRKESALKAQLAEVNRQIEQNDACITELESNEYLEWVAREKLNMKGRDEEAFVPKANQE